EHPRIVELAERLLSASAADGAGELNGVGEAEPRRFRFYEKDTEQYHICFGGPGISRGDERRYALGILDAIFGGSVSSRLFREVREKRGLAYSVGSYAEQFVDRGTIAMYVGTRADNVAEACEIIGRELARLHSDGVTADELSRAKEHVKGRMVLGLEATGARMARIARGILFDVPLYSLDELLERVDAVELDELAELARELYDPAGLAAACVGPDEGRFRSAAAQVSQQLAVSS
ncbi:MAG: M16 family metallopeptidase, partial [Solirubrobacterales bacterium]